MHNAAPRCNSRQDVRPRAARGVRLWVSEEKTRALRVRCIVLKNREIMAAGRWRKWELAMRGAAGFYRARRVSARWALGVIKFHRYCQMHINLNNRVFLLISSMDSFVQYSRDAVLRWLRSMKMNLCCTVVLGTKGNFTKFCIRDSGQNCMVHWEDLWIFKIYVNCWHAYFLYRPIILCSKRSNMVLIRMIHAEC